MFAIPLLQVGSGIFDELDFTVEAGNIQRFQRLYGKACKKLGVLVPEVLTGLTSTRVLVTQWIDGVPPRDLASEDRARLASVAVRCLAMQLMTDGFIHCDPHEGKPSRPLRARLVSSSRQLPPSTSPSSPFLGACQATSLRLQTAAWHFSILG